MNYVLSIILVPIAVCVAFAGEKRDRAAAAWSASCAACQQPASPAKPVPVAPVAPVPAKVDKTCPCSAQCACGCNEGKECSCGNAPAMKTAPVDMPMQQSQYQPVFRRSTFQPAGNCAGGS